MLDEHGETSYHFCRDPDCYVAAEIRCANCDLEYCLDHWELHVEETNHESMRECAEAEL